MNYQKRLLTYALEYARAGYYVFPMSVFMDQETGKKRISIPFPRTEGWREESTRDEDTIRAWFSSPRKSMKGLGIDCGKSGVVVVDLDTGDGKNGLEEWEKLPEQQPTPMTATTRSGGVHRFYRDPSGRVRNSAGVVAPGVDIRGAGGMVIAPPTRVWGSDGVYRLDGEIVPVSELPELSPGMIEVVTARQEAEGRPKFDPAIHGSYKVSRTQGEEILAERLRRLESGQGMRAAIFGYAVAVAQFEAAKAAADETEPDPDTLRAYIADQILPVVPWDELNDEDRQWIDDGVTKGLANPWELVPEEEVTPLVDPETPLVELLQRVAPKLPGSPDREHTQCAPVIVDALQGRYLYVGGLGWHEWVGDRWSPEPRVPVLHTVARVIDRGIAEASTMLASADRNVELLSAFHELEELQQGLKLRIRSDKIHLQLVERVERVLSGERARASTYSDERALADLLEPTVKWIRGWENARRWWSGLSNGRNLREVMKFVEANPGKIFVRASDLDRDPYLLNTPSGTVDLRTGSIRRHDPADFITKSTNVPYDPDATHPLWDKAREAFAPGTEEWLQLKVGEGAFGFPSSDDTMLFNFGQGSNGKSTLTDAILHGLGEYAVFLHDKAVLGGKDDHGTEKMVFRGARWAILEELPEAQVLRPATIKKLIGTSKITARLMRQDNVTFDATHCLLVNSNHRPQVLENDRGTWRRLVAVPWPYTFKFDGEELTDENDRRADPAVKHALSRDIEVQKAALAWIVEGAVRYYQRGSTAGPLPELVQRETESWRRESDVFGMFFESELTVDPRSAVSTSELLAEYNEYLSSMGKNTVSDQYVSARLSTMPGCKGVTKKQVLRTSKRISVSTRQILSDLPNRFWAWVGVRWLTDEEKVAQGADEG